MTVKNGQIGSEIFLQNKFFSIGVNSDGGLGTLAAAPVGFDTEAAAGRLRVGLYADLDGWGVGKATPLHDALLPGRTIEGFNVGYQLNGEIKVASNQQLTGLSEIAGTVANTSNATRGEADWAGATADKLAIAQKLTLTDDAKYIKVEVTLTNNSSTAMADVRYMRTADPDQGTTYSTNNKIIEQGNGSALIGAYAAGGTTPYFLYANDPRARVSVYGFINDDPYAALAYEKAQAAGYSKAADLTINLTFAVGTLKAGESTTVTLYMGVTDDLPATIAAINAGPVNLAPAASDDFAEVEGSVALTGNVLLNDKDPEGAALTAKLVSGPTNGTLALAADGTYTYTAKAGFVGADRFTYAASDGKLSDTATVSITVNAPPVNPVPGQTDPLLTRPGTIDGSASTSDSFTAAAYHNSIFFDVKAKSGVDTVTGFDADDVLVTTVKLYDGNGDGIIGLAAGRLSLDGPKSADRVVLEGVGALRTLGTDQAGNYVYADASVRPNGAVEGTLGDNVLKGDTTDKTSNSFFFDTALDINLGDDRIDNFGAKDILVTTSAFSSTAKAGDVIVLGNGIVQLAGGSGAPGDKFVPGEVGTIDLNAIGGGAVSAVEFDGTVSHDGTTYFVYSLVGSAAGVGDLTF